MYPNLVILRSMVHLTGHLGSPSSSIRINEAGELVPIVKSLISLYLHISCYITSFTKIMEGMGYGLAYGLSLVSLRLALKDRVHIYIAFD